MSCALVFWWYFYLILLNGTCILGAETISLLRGGRKLLTDHEEGDKRQSRRYFAKARDKKHGLVSVISTVDYASTEIKQGLFSISIQDDVGLQRFQQDFPQFDLEEDHEVHGFSTRTPSNSISPRHLPHQFSFRDLSRRLTDMVPYGISMIEADQLDFGTADIAVCIVDSGIAIDHPDLNATMISGDDNFEHSQGSILRWDQDVDGHGTMTAGIISAISGNNRGVRGAGRIKLHITRGLDDQLLGRESDVMFCITQCITAGAKIITLSLGATAISKEFDKYLTKVVAKQDVLLLAASGNDSTDLETFPASHPSTISIGAVGKDARHARFSNFGDQVELVAPGDNILSTTVNKAAIILDDYSYPAYQLSPKISDVSGEVRLCNVTGNFTCSGANGSICLLARDLHSSTELVEQCVNHGGKAAILFDADDKEKQVWYTLASEIPVLVISHTSGMMLVEQTADPPTLATLGFPGNSMHHTYDFDSGTSMAVPHVAAAAALVWSHFPECTNHQIRYVLARTALDGGAAGCDPLYGYGVVQTKAAYDFLMANSCHENNWEDLIDTDGGCSFP